MFLSFYEAISIPSAHFRRTFFSSSTHFQVSMNLNSLDCISLQLEHSHHFCLYDDSLDGIFGILILRRKTSNLMEFIWFCYQITEHKYEDEIQILHFPCVYGKFGDKYHSKWTTIYISVAFLFADKNDCGLEYEDVGLSAVVIISEFASVFSVFHKSEEVSNKTNGNSEALPSWATDLV